MMRPCDAQPHANTLSLLGASLCFASIALAHDSWISRGLFRNGAGEFCCGQGDCFMVPPDQVSMIGTGYRLFGAEWCLSRKRSPAPTAHSGAASGRTVRAAASSRRHH